MKQLRSFGWVCRRAAIPLVLPVIGAAFYLSIVYKMLLGNSEFIFLRDMAVNMHEQLSLALPMMAMFIVFILAYHTDALGEFLTVKDKRIQFVLAVVASLVIAALVSWRLVAWRAGWIPEMNRVWAYGLLRTAVFCGFAVPLYTVTNHLVLSCAIPLAMHLLLGSETKIPNGTTMVIFLVVLLVTVAVTAVIWVLNKRNIDLHMKINGRGKLALAMVAVIAFSLFGFVQLTPAKDKTIAQLKQKAEAYSGELGLPDDPDSIEYLLQLQWLDRNYEAYIWQEKWGSALAGEIYAYYSILFRTNRYNYFRTSDESELILDNYLHWTINEYEGLLAEDTYGKYLWGQEWYNHTSLLDDADSTGFTSIKMYLETHIFSMSYSDLQYRAENHMKSTGNAHEILGITLFELSEKMTLHREWAANVRLDPIEQKRAIIYYRIQYTVLRYEEITGKAVDTSDWDNKDVGEVLDRIEPMVNEINAHPSQGERNQTYNSMYSHLGIPTCEMLLLI